jgi:hypothetical protein
MNRALQGLLWLVLPIVPLWRQSLPDGRTVPLRLVLVDSVGRLLLLALIVWFALTGEWLGALVGAIFLLLLAAMRYGTSRLVERLEPKR